MGSSRQEYWSGVPFPSPGESYSRVQVSNTCRATIARVPVAPAPPPARRNHTAEASSVLWLQAPLPSWRFHVAHTPKAPSEAGSEKSPWQTPRGMETHHVQNPFTAPAPALRPAPPHGLQHHSQGRHGPKPETTRQRPPPLTLPCIQPAAVPCQASCEPSFMRLPPLHGHHLSFPDLQAASRLPSTYTVYTNNPGKAQAGTAPQTPGPTLRSSGSHEGWLSPREHFRDGGTIHYHRDGGLITTSGGAQASWTAPMHRAETLRTLPIATQFLKILLDSLFFFFFFFNNRITWSMCFILLYIKNIHW